MEMTPAEMEADILRANAMFNAMTPEDRRVWIALDVLKQLRAKKIIAVTGAFFRDTPGLWEVDKNAQFGRYFKSMTIGCQVCAIGAAVISAAEQFDKCRVGYLAPYGVIRADIMEEYLLKFFSKDQYAMIENAFERGEGALRGVAVLGVKEAIGFFDQFVDSDDRMRLIWENVVMGCGTFDPARKPIAMPLSGWTTKGFDQRWLDD